MSVTILNKTAYDNHAAQIGAVVELAKAEGWSEPDGQSASMDNLVTAPKAAPEVSAAPAPKDTPDFKPE